MRKLEMPREKTFMPRIQTRPRRQIGIPRIRINKGLAGMVPKIKKF